MKGGRVSLMLAALLLFGAGLAFLLTRPPANNQSSLAQVPTSVTTQAPAIASASVSISASVPVPLSTVVPATYEVLPTIGPEERQTRVALFGPQMPYTSAEATAISAEAEMYQSLRTRTGAIVAQGTNTIPTGALHVRTYRLEEVRLPAPFSFTRHVTGRDITVDRVWRLTVTGGRFQVRSASINVYIDGVYAGVGGLGGQSPEHNELVALIFDGSILREGAAIAVSYSTGDAYTELPERLHFKP